MTPLESAFPGLAESGYAVTSPATTYNNCIAWAAGDTNRWWWPDPIGIGYWPHSAPREQTLQAFMAAFESLGYSPVANNDVELNIEKIAIYAQSGVPTHAARQLTNGRWTSKLGQSVDIEHALPDLVGSIYGVVAVILARPKS